MNPDLTIEYYAVCPSTRYFHKVVTGDTGTEYEVTYGYHPTGDYEYSWTCTCKGFQYTGNCKHIKATQHQRCAWNESAFCGSAEEAPADSKCPNCGQLLEVIRVAV